MELCCHILGAERVIVARQARPQATQARILRGHAREGGGEIGETRYRLRVYLCNRSCGLAEALSCGSRTIGELAQVCRDLLRVVQERQQRGVVVHPFQGETAPWLGRRQQHEQRGRVGKLLLE